VEGTNSSLEPRLAQGQLDLAVLGQPIISTEINEADLFSEDLVLVVPSSHRLAATDHRVSLEELGTIDLLLPLAGTSIRHEIDEACAARGVRLHPIAELDGLRTLASLVFDGYGPAILPATALPVHLRDQFAAVPVDGLPPRRVALAMRRYGFPASAVRAMRQLLFRLVAEATSLPRGVHPLVDVEVA
jgi:DNA-binding transcriptional LysR family regulator